MQINCISFAQQRKDPSSYIILITTALFPSCRRVKSFITTAYRPSMSLRNYETSSLPSMPTLQMVPTCKSSSRTCRFREAARTAGVLQSRSLFLFSWEMNPTTLTYYQKDMQQHLIDCLESGLFTPFQQRRRPRERSPT